jgi:hypothetical protein
MPRAPSASDDITSLSIRSSRQLQLFTFPTVVQTATTAGFPRHVGIYPMQMHERLDSDTDGGWGGWGDARGPKRSGNDCSYFPI